MAMFLFLDSNLRNAFDFGGRQLSTIFPEAVQRNAHSCSDRAATISQISYRLRLQTPGQLAGIVFGGFENFCTGTRSIVQHAPLEEIKSELSEYVKMITDILVIYPNVTVYVLPPMFRGLPLWYSSTFETILSTFICDVSHIDLARVLVVPPLHVSPEDLDFDGVHLKPVALQRLLDLLLVSFRDGVFVKPADYPLSEDISKIDGLYFLCCFYGLIDLTILRDSVFFLTHFNGYLYLVLFSFISDAFLCMS
jgi:hypothetical protein